MPKFSVPWVVAGVLAVGMVGVAVWLALALTSRPQLIGWGDEKINAELPAGWTVQGGSFISPDGSLEVTATVGGCGLNTGVEPTLPPSGLTFSGDPGGGTCHGYAIGNINIIPGP